MAEETITNAELASRLGDLRADLHDDLGEIKQQLARLVPREVYDAHRAAFEQRLSVLEQRQTAADKAADDHEETHRTSNRYVISAIIVPVIAILVQLLLSAKGVHL